MSSSTKILIVFVVSIIASYIVGLGVMANYVIDSKECFNPNHVECNKKLGCE